MKTILCFGDSNTWGCQPIVNLERIERFSRWERWTGVLQRELGEDYYVIEEGLGGRTTVWSDPIEGSKNGREHLIPALDSHQPLDLVIIMLGTNDLKARFSAPAYDIAEGAGVLVGLVQNFQYLDPSLPKPRVLLIAPPPIMQEVEFPDYFQEMFGNAGDKSLLFSKHFERIANRYQCDYLNAAELIRASPRDGIHYEKEDHQNLGLALAAKIRQLLS